MTDSKNAKSGPIEDWRGAPDDPVHKLLVRWLSLSCADREREFADTARAAEIVGVARRTIQGWIDDGRIQAVPIGKRYYVNLDSLRYFLASRVSFWSASR